MIDENSISAKLLDVLRAAYGEDFNAYYDGDPVLIGVSNLPAIVVDTTDARISTAMTGVDSLNEEITIKVIFNKKDDYGADSGTVTTVRKIKNFIYATDNGPGGPSDVTWNKQSLLSLVRQNFTLDGLSVDSNVKVSLGIQPRPQDMNTHEGHVIISTERLVRVNNRT